MFEVQKLGYGEPLNPRRRFVRGGDVLLEWELGMTGRCLRFGARFGEYASVADGAAEGGFHEGLWEGDVVELFVAGATGAGYLEFNLAPNGAWWACGFTGARERAADFAPPPVSAHAGDVVELWIDVRGLPFELAGARANVTAILAGGYYSVVDLPEPQPDFHRPDAFVDLLLR